MQWTPEGDRLSPVPLDRQYLHQHQKDERTSFTRGRGSRDAGNNNEGTAGDSVACQMTEWVQEVCATDFRIIRQRERRSQSAPKHKSHLHSLLPDHRLQAKKNKDYSSSLDTSLPLTPSLYLTVSPLVCLSSSACSPGPDTPSPLTGRTAPRPPPTHETQSSAHELNIPSLQLLLLVWCALMLHETRHSGRKRGSGEDRVRRQTPELQGLETRTGETACTDL